MRAQSFLIRIKFYFVYDVQWPEDQCLIFVNDYQGHDHLPTSARGKVGKGHVGVDGLMTRDMIISPRVLVARPSVVR